MPEAGSLDRTEEGSQHVTDYFMKQDAVSSVTIVDGYSLLDSQNKNNAGAFFIGFKSFDERYKFANIKTQDARAVVTRAYENLSKGKEGGFLTANAPRMQGLGTTGWYRTLVRGEGHGGNA